jgi:hypothetical protein
VVKKLNWQVQHECSQCGAPIILEETDRLFSCRYCRVRLYQAAGDYFRYHLPPAADPARDIIYVPYWRFRGLSFSCESFEVRHKVIDTTLLAAHCKGLPVSLGFRPQILKLRFLSAETSGRFLKTRLSAEQFLATRDLHGQGGNAAAAGSLFHQVFVGETVSAIYAPLYVQGEDLYDAILNRALDKAPQSDRLAAEPLEPAPNWLVKFIPALCPHCGWDLEGERDSLVLFCRHCDTAWQSSANGLEPLAFAVVPNGRATSLYLPFWRMAAPVSGLQLRSYADLARLANLPTAIQPAWETLDLYFWAPAFKVRPELFLQLAKLLTLSRGLEPVADRLPAHSMHPVTLPAQEAGQAIKATLAHLAAAKRKLFPLLPGIEAPLKEYLLVYIPFDLQGGDLVQFQIPLSINLTALNLGRKL